MWFTYYNYYLNLIRDNDRNLKGVIDALTALDLWDSTVVFRTADHGELGGSHGGSAERDPSLTSRSVMCRRSLFTPNTKGAGTARH